MEDKTLFNNKCKILSDLWMLHRHDDQYQILFSTCDLGFPLAYCVAENIISSVGPEAKKLIDETFDTLLKTVEREDIGFSALGEVIILGGE